MSRRWDAIVVGARVAGSSTAMLLAQAGLRVLLVDRARRGSDTLSTHALMRGGVLQLRRWGLLEAVIAAGTPPIRRTVFYYGDDIVPVTLRPAAGVTELYAPRRTVLDPLLADAAIRAGATLRYGTTVTGLIRDGDRIAGVELLDRSGARRREQAALVIGADGRRSTVASAVQARTLLAGTAIGRVRYGYWRNLDAAGYEWFYDPGRTAGVIPTNGGLACVFIGWPDSSSVRRRTMPDPPSALLNRLRRAHLVGRERHVPVEPGFVRQAWGPGWALVGDAGYRQDPLSTHGMTDALRDADLLARAIVAAPDPGPNQQQALSAYEATRDRLSLPMMDIVEQIASYSWDLTEVQRLLRALASTMTDEVEELGALEPAA